MTEPLTPTGEALAEEDQTAASEAPDPRRWLALAVLAAAQLMIVLDASIVNIALPSAQEDLGISDADRQWIVTAYTLAFGGLLLLGGRIADYTGRKRTFIIGLLGFAGASALGGIAANQELLFAARAPPGRVRRADGAGRAVHRHGDVHRPEGAGQGVRRLRRARRRRRGDRPDRRRRPDRVRLLALVPRRQRAGRADRRRLPPFPLVHESKAHGDTRYDVPGVLLATLGLVSLVYGFTEAARAKHPEIQSDTSVQGWTAPRRSPSWSPPSCCWSRSCGGRPGPRTRCCRCGSCSTATAAGPT